MPDQSSAATEHAILQEITAPLSTLPDDALPIAADVDFPVVLRGYDRLAVDAYVKKTSQLVAELQATRSPEAAVRRALERVGEQISGILQRAHETAEEITGQSRREAEDRLEKARQEAAEITAQAQVRLKELDVETDRIWGERHRIVDDVRELSRQLVELAEAAGNRFPPAEEPEPAPGGEAAEGGTEATQQAAVPEPLASEGEEATAVRHEDEATAVLPPLHPGAPEGLEHPPAPPEAQEETGAPESGSPEHGESPELGEGPEHGGSSERSEAPEWFGSHEDKPGTP